MNDKPLVDNDKIIEIRTSVDIVDIVSEYVNLTEKGKNFFGVCPFHDDHSPSMSVSRDKQMYKCFSCGAGGNVINFVMDYENISFLDALKKLADRAGISLDLKSYHKSSLQTKFKDYYTIYDLAFKLYGNNINTELGKQAREYLQKRDIDSKCIKTFGIGLALKNNTMLLNMLKKKGYEESYLLKIGLLNQYEEGCKDKFYDRIMFPLHDLTGKVIGFSGRIYNREDKSKYINTQETDVFKKGELLYNYHIAKNIARQKNQIIVVEGFMDVIRMHTIGIDNVIATMGTACTKNQLTLIKKMAKEIILCYDGDEAGQKANDTISQELSKLGCHVKIALLTDNYDPDEYIVKYGKEKFQSKIDHAVNPMDFKLNYLKQKKDLTSSQDMASYVNEMIQALNDIEDPVLTELTLQKISEESKLSIDFLKSKIQQKKVKKQEVKPVIKKQCKIDKYQKAEQGLLYYMLLSSEVIKIYQKKVSFMPTYRYRMLAREICYFYKEYHTINSADLIIFLRDSEEEVETLKEIMNLNLKEEYTKEEILDYVKLIRDGNIKNEITRIKEQLKQEIDTMKKTDLAVKIVELQKQMEKEI